jgi:hypothetical protein
MKDGNNKNAREKKKDFFVIPRYLSRPVFGNQRTTTRTQHCHYASLGRQFFGISTRSGLRPNGFWGVPGNSDWDSAALTFPEIFSLGLRQFASTRLHGTLRVLAIGG